MILSTLTMAMGIAMLVPARMSETPQALGLLVLVGSVLIAVACALHLSAVIESLPRLGAAWRLALVAGAWAGILVGVAWCISRAPGIELVVALMTVPILVGAAGIASVPESRRWHAAPFMAFAIGLFFLLLPVLITRQLG